MASSDSKYIPRTAIVRDGALALRVGIAASRLTNRYRYDDRKKAVPNSN